MKTSFLFALALAVVASLSCGADEPKKEGSNAFAAAQGRAAATQVLQDLRMIDSAMDQYAIENNKPEGAPVIWANLLPYLKAGTRLHGSGGKDPLGNLYVIKVVGVAPKVSSKTAAAFDVPATFWDPFAPQAGAEGEKKEATGAPPAKQGRATANDVLAELRLIDSAIDQYAIEMNKKDGDPVVWANLLPYFKAGTRLQGSGGKDPSGRPYIIKVVGIPPKLSVKTAETFEVPVTFWDPYKPE